MTGGADGGEAERKEWAASLGFNRGPLEGEVLRHKLVGHCIVITARADETWRVPVAEKFDVIPRHKADPDFWNSTGEHSRTILIHHEHSGADPASMRAATAEREFAGRLITPLDLPGLTRRPEHTGNNGQVAIAEHCVDGLIAQISRRRHRGALIGHQGPPG